MERQRSRAERLNKGCDGVSESLGDARHRESESTGNYEEKHSALSLSQPFNFETTFPATKSSGNYQVHTNQYHQHLLALASRFYLGSNRVEQVHAESFSPLHRGQLRQAVGFPNSWLEIHTSMFDFQLPVRNPTASW